MSIEKECPICMEIIDFKKNCVTTDCSHCFHTNCLMTSVAHNGFGCPYCRTAMAEEIKDDIDDKYEEDDDDEEDEMFSDDEEDEMFSDDALRSFRFFMNRMNGEEIEDDITPQQPSPIFITQKLIEKGVTMEELVKIMLFHNEEYYENEEEEREFEMIQEDVFTKIALISSDYELRITSDYGIIAQ